MENQEILSKYQTDGFVVIDDVFTAGEIATMREAAESPEVSGEVQKAGGAHQTVHLLGLTARHPLFLELAKDQRLIDLLTPLLGPDIQLQHSKMAAQAMTPKAGGFGWHQDFAFFPHTNTSLAAVMVMLDDATPENGCMRMLRGSHKLGLRNHLREGHFTGGCQETSLWEDAPEQVIPVTPRAGGISIHHCLTLHGSGQNISGLPRRGVVFQYRADDAYQLADAIFPDTGLLVSGERRGIVRCESASWVLPRRPGTNQFGSAWNQEGEFARQFDEGTEG